ncbi:Hairy/enhancer-of-split with YRPW motif protein 2 [Pleodorina starrii]|nr:Hairy/enhancer-of-split with YRPW motif protein 2 [Pleodorina starrii]
MAEDDGAAEEDGGGGDRCRDRIIAAVLAAAAAQGSSGSGVALPAAIIIFGDSLTDTGNVLNRSHCLVPTPQAYWLGRFSDGPVWADHLYTLAAAYNASANLTIQNYAHGGARACGLDPIRPPPGVVDLPDQISLYLASAPSAVADNGTVAAADGACLLPLQPVAPAAAINASSSAESGRAACRLFIMEAGVNDLNFFALKQTTDDPKTTFSQIGANITACRVAALDRLMAALVNSTSKQQRQQAISDGEGGGGCRDRIIVWNLPPLSFAPLIPEASRSYLDDVIAAHNAGLEASLAPLRERYPEGPSLEVYDTNTVATAVILEAGVVGLNSTAGYIKFKGEPGSSAYDKAMWLMTSSRRSDVCGQPSHYVSFDGIHPSSIIHSKAFAEPFATWLGWI